jgi:hypothetical protein
VRKEREGRGEERPSPSSLPLSLSLSPHRALVTSGKGKQKKEIMREFIQRHHVLIPQEGRKKGKNDMLTNQPKGRGRERERTGGGRGRNRQSKLLVKWVGDEMYKVQVVVRVASSSERFLAV